MHPLEVQGDRGRRRRAGHQGRRPDPGQPATREDIDKGEADPSHRLKLSDQSHLAPTAKSKKGPRYTPVSRRQDRPNALSAVDQAFVEQTREKKRQLRANLEFYKGVVCLGLGIPKELFTANFAASRVFGWVAHVVEQRADNRLIRPVAQYVGPASRRLRADCAP